MEEVGGSVDCVAGKVGARLTSHRRSDSDRDRDRAQTAQLSFVSTFEGVAADRNWAISGL